MSGAKPAFLAKQLGHSLRMFFEVYAKWISSVDDRHEMAKVDDALGNGMIGDDTDARSKNGEREK